MDDMPRLMKMNSKLSLDDRVAEGQLTVYGYIR